MRTPWRLGRPIAAGALLAALACGGGTEPRSPYSAALLVGSWRSDVACPYDGTIYDYVLTASRLDGREVISGQQRPRRCPDEPFSTIFPAVTATFDARTGAVRIETVVQCCTGQEHRQFVHRFDGRFVDSGVISGSQAAYLVPDGQRASTPIAFSLVRE